MYFLLKMVIFHCYISLPEGRLVRKSNFAQPKLKTQHSQMRRMYPIGSMYGIFTYIWFISMVNVGKYTIHGSCGYG